MKWPAASAKREWEMFDLEVDQVLEATMAGYLRRKMKTMSKIIWTMGQTAFERRRGNPKSKQMPKGGRKPVGRLVSAKRAFHQAREDEKPALKEICDNVRARIKTLRRAECHRTGGDWQRRG